jgi:hypothetical protein
VAGKASYYEVLEAQQQLFPAENSLAQAQLNQLLAFCPTLQSPRRRMGREAPTSRNPARKELRCLKEGSLPRYGIAPKRSARLRSGVNAKKPNGVPNGVNYTSLEQSEWPVRIGQSSALGKRSQTFIPRLPIDHS